MGNLDDIKQYEDTDLFGNTIVTKQLAIKDRIGFLPVSVWEPTKEDWRMSTEWKGIIGDTGQTRELVGKDMALPGSKYTTSIFNPVLAMKILSAYCPQNAYIYDAFGGGGTRGYVASAMGHRYLGVEIREDEVQRIREQQNTVQNAFELVVGDSTKYNIAEEAFDFSYSCPPYYDLEVYSKDPSDLSSWATYEQFLEGITASLAVTYKGLKPGAMCVWVVGNFRNEKTGELRHFNGDTVRAARSVGFTMWDEIIWKGASPSAVQRAGQFEANRKIVRMHESVLVFKK